MKEEEYENSVQKFIQLLYICGSGDCIASCLYFNCGENCRCYLIHAAGEIIESYFNGCKSIEDHLDKIETELSLKGETHE